MQELGLYCGECRTIFLFSSVLFYVLNLELTNVRYTPHISLYILNFRATKNLYDVDDIENGFLDLSFILIITCFYSVSGQIVFMQELSNDSIFFCNLHQSGLRFSLHVKIT